MLVSIIQFGYAVNNCGLPPCSATWTYVPDVTIPSPPGCGTCWVKASYSWRYCDGYLDIRIGTVRISANCSCPSEFPLMAYIANYINTHNTKFQDLIANEKLNNPNDPPWCVENVRTQLFLCWSYGDSYLNPDEEEEIPVIDCLENYCCTVVLTYCTEDENLQIFGYPTVTNTSCDDCVCDPFEGHECQTDCGWFAEHQPLKISMEQLKPETILDSKRDIVSIVPNPSNGNVTIIYKTTIKGDYKIIFNDVLGKTIFEDISYINSNQFQKDVSLKNFPDGKYFYKLILKGEVLQTGKIDIVK